jgi:hypothetical protein
VFGVRSVALELEADEELPVKPKLMTKWDRAIKSWEQPDNDFC